MGWRELSEEAQHFAFWVGLVVAVLTATGAGVYWNWWAYVWNVPPPARAFGVLAAIMSVFVMWWFIALVAHHYIGWPKTHPFGAAVVRPVVPRISTPTRERLIFLFRAHGEPAFSEATNLLSSIARDLERAVRDVGSSEGALLLDAREARLTQMQVLRDALDGTKGDQFDDDTLQRQFGTFYKSYQWCSNWIHFAGRDSGYPFAALHPYRMWRATDAEFLRELARETTRDGMEILRDAVNEVGWGETIRATVPLLNDVVMNAPSRRIVERQRCTISLGSGERSQEATISLVDPKRVRLEWEPRHLVMVRLGHGNASLTVTRYSSNAKDEILGYVEIVEYDTEVNDESGPFLVET